jgi:hypothetical protein
LITPPGIVLVRQDGRALRHEVAAAQDELLDLRDPREDGRVRLCDDRVARGGAEGGGVDDEVAGDPRFIQVVRVDPGVDAADGDPGLESQIVADVHRRIRGGFIDRHAAAEEGDARLGGHGVVAVNDEGAAREVEAGGS